mgnify:CR=1 FL=1
MGNESDSRNPFGELCHIRLNRFQITCAHDGCNAKVHRDCQRHWISLAWLPHIDNIPIYCPTHNRQRGDYITSYYEHKKMPDYLKLTTSKSVEQQENCVVCLYPIDANTRVTSSCNHTFHYDCVFTWMQNEVSYTCDLSFLDQ